MNQCIVRSNLVLAYRNRILNCIFQNAILVFLNSIKKYLIVERQFFSRKAVRNTHLVYENKFHGRNDFSQRLKRIIKKWFSLSYDYYDYHNRNIRYEKTPIVSHRSSSHFIFRIKPLALSDSSVNW